MRNENPTPWTEKEREQLRRLWEGQPYASTLEIAAKLRRSQAAVIRQAHRMNLSRKSPVPPNRHAAPPPPLRPQAGPVTLPPLPSLLLPLPVVSPDEGEE